MNDLSIQVGQANTPILPWLEEEIREAVSPVSLEDLYDMTKRAARHFNPQDRIRMMEQIDMLEKMRASIKRAQAALIAVHSALATLQTAPECPLLSMATSE